MDEFGTPVILAIFFSFVIGVVFGGMAVFLARGMVVNRQLRIAQKKAAKLVAEARLEAKDVLNQASRDADKVKLQAEAEYRERRTELCLLYTSDAADE